MPTSSPPPGSPRTSEYPGSYPSFSPLLKIIGVPGIVFMRPCNPVLELLFSSRTLSRHLPALRGRILVQEFFARRLEMRLAPPRPSPKKRRVQRAYASRQYLKNIAAFPPRGSSPREGDIL